MAESCAYCRRGGGDWCVVYRYGIHSSTTYYLLYVPRFLDSGINLLITCALGASSELEVKFPFQFQFSILSTRVRKLFICMLVDIWYTVNWRPAPLMVRRLSFFLPFSLVFGVIVDLIDVGAHGFVCIDRIRLIKVLQESLVRWKTNKGKDHKRK